MKAFDLRFGICLLAFCVAHNAVAEVSFRAVAVSGDAAVGFGGDAKFSQFSCLSLACDGRVAFSGQALGTGITIANSGGVWAGLPGSLNLMARAGNPAPGMPTGVTFQLFNGVNIDCYQNMAFSSSLQGPGISPDSNGGLWIAGVEAGQIPIPAALIIPDSNHLAGAAIVGKTVSSGCSGEALIHNTNVFACGVDLSGSGITGNNENAIIEGAYDNWSIAVQTGNPAPGSGGNFSGLVTDQKALSPDGTLAFKSNEGLWLKGSPGLQAIGLTGKAAPASIAGANCTYEFLSDLVEINSQDQVAFMAYLNGPNLNNTNNQFVVAGAPGALHTVAQSGQPAPGIPGGLFQGPGGGSVQIFDDTIISSDGSVAFVAACGTNGYDYGLWFAPAGGSPRLVVATGTQAPGAATGVVFTNSSFQFLSPFQEIYLNANHQLVFLAQVGGAGVGSTNNTGIWFVDSDGGVSLLVRSGDTINASGVSRALGTVTFGSVGVPIVGSTEDGRPVPFNDNGNVFFWANMQSGQGLFLAQNGIVLGGVPSGTNFLVQFPTISGKHYRVDYTTNLPPPATWPVLLPSVLGTGGQMTITNTNGAVFDQRYYRVVRTD